MRQDWRLLVICGLVLIAALVLGVGIVSHGVLRHIVQTVPMWIAIVLAIRGSGYAKWAALPCFWFWLVLMIEIWLFLLGVNHLISGTFTPIERAMTIVVAIASAVAIMKSIRTRSGVPLVPAVATFVAVTVLQFCLMRLSFIESIAHR